MLNRVVTPKLFVISAPAGTGKTSLVKQLLHQFPHLRQSISVTTRAQRAGEIDQQDYIFVDKKEFLKRKRQKLFLETATIFSHHYGTEKKTLFATLNQGFHVILVIDVSGAKKVKRQTDAVLIFISPPSLTELKKRLLERNTETTHSIELRLQRVKQEIKEAKYYDYHIINDDFNMALAKLKAIIIAEENKVEKVRGKNAFNSTKNM